MLIMEVHFYGPWNFALHVQRALWLWGAIATETWANESWVDSQFRRMKPRFIDGACR